MFKVTGNLFSFSGFGTLSRGQLRFRRPPLQGGHQSAGTLVLLFVKTCEAFTPAIPPALLILVLNTLEENASSIIFLYFKH